MGILFSAQKHEPTASLDWPLDCGTRHPTRLPLPPGLLRSRTLFHVHRANPPPTEHFLWLHAERTGHFSLGRC